MSQWRIAVGAADGPITTIHHDAASLSRLTLPLG
jgi:hypothetical protein